MTRPTEAEIEAALAECRRTHTGVNPCYDPDYMLARRQYHLLMIEAGVMRRQDMDKA